MSEISNSQLGAEYARNDKYAELMGNYVTDLVLEADANGNPIEVEKVEEIMNDIEAVQGYLDEQAFIRYGKLK
jgi:hypothetical protein